MVFVEAHAPRGVRRVVLRLDVQHDHAIRIVLQVLQSASAVAFGAVFRGDGEMLDEEHVVQLPVGDEADRDAFIADGAEVETGIVEEPLVLEERTAFVFGKRDVVDHPELLELG